MTAIDDARISYDNSKLELQRQTGFANSDFSLLARKVSELAANRGYGIENKKTLLAIESLKIDIEMELGQIVSLAEDMIAKLTVINNPT